MNRTILVMLSLFWSGCAVTQQEIASEAPAHHTSVGYKNLYIDDPEKSFFNFLNMRFFGDEPWADHFALADEVPTQKVEIQQILTSADTPQITWLGHSTFLIQHKGINVLTDPVFADRASPVSFAGPKRYSPHVIDYKRLPKVDVVVISHNHYDHLDQEAINVLGNNTHYVVPLGIGDWLREQNVKTDKITELDWWQTTRVKNVELQALPSQHWSARGLGDRFTTLWASWSLKMSGLHVWFAGDTGYNDRLFKDIGEQIDDVDLSLIPIGAYAPRWFMQTYHVNPREAVMIHQDIGSKKV